MSVIQRIQEKQKWVFGTIAAALIIFIVQDALVRRSSFFSNGTTVGKVNGQKIERDDFENKIESVQQMQGEQAPTREQLIPNVWEYMVQQAILQQQIDKLGLAFSGKEINDVLFGANPPYWMKQQFTDPSTGVFKVDEAKAYFAQIKKEKNNPRLADFYNNFIQPSIDQALAAKYEAMITKAVYIPKWMAEKNNADANALANISYVFVPYSSITDSTIKVSDDEINTYVQKHKKEYKQEDETRNIAYVSFSAAPSTDDTLAVRNNLESIKPELLATQDAKAFVGNKGSELPFSDGYVTAVNMKMPNADSIKALADGQVFGPYIDQQNLVLAKMVGRRVMPDSVKVRHILVMTQQQGKEILSDSIAKIRIDSIATAARTGANFDSLVVKYSDDGGSKQKGGEYEFSSMQSGNLAKEFTEVAFFGNTGDKKVVKIDGGSYTGYSYIEVLDQKNKQEAYKVAYIAKAINASQETISAANTAALQFASVSRTKEQFDENVAKQKLIALPAQGIKENDYQIQSLGQGSNRPFVKWIYEGKVGDVSEPTEINDRFIVAVITSSTPAGVLSAKEARPLVEGILVNEKKAQIIINTKLKGNSLDAYAQSAGVTVGHADSLAFVSYTVPNVGNEPKMIGAAFNKSLQSKISDPIAGYSGVFVVKNDAIYAKASFGGSVEEQQKMLETNVINQVSRQGVTPLRKAATVKDYRSTFY